MVRLDTRWTLTALMSMSVAKNYWSTRTPLVVDTMKEDAVESIVVGVDFSSSRNVDLDFSKEDVTIIVTTNLIPTSPDIMVVNETIRSLPKFLHGLSKTTPLIITVDGLDDKARSREPRADRRFAKYVQNLRQEFNRPHETVIAQPERINLIGNLQEAISRVQTEFVYIIQHDMPFLKAVNHSALISTFREYPETVKMVRFNYVRRHADKFNNCDESEIHFSRNGIELTKHHVWSDK